MKCSQVYYLTIGLLLIATVAWATAQVSSPMIVDGKKHYVHGRFLNKEAHERLDAWKKMHGYADWENTGNYKGYYIRLKVENNKLFIIEISVDSEYDEKGRNKAIVPLKELFGKEGPIYATWVNGVLTEYLGPFRGSQHVTENKRQFHFKKGVLIKVDKIIVEWELGQKDKKQPSMYKKYNKKFIERGGVTE
jgi:hypothetical protein